jgi:hypothetical protein
MQKIADNQANSTTLVGQCNISHPTTAPTPIITNPSTPSSSSTRTPGVNHTIRVSQLLPHFRRDSRTFDTDDLHHALDTDTVPVPEVVSEEWAGGNLGYRKGEGEVPLEARIERIFYINLYGQVSRRLPLNLNATADMQEIFPEPNPEFLQTISKRDVLVYSCGSLWTSIVPSIALRGLATAIATSPSLKARVVLRKPIHTASIRARLTGSKFCQRPRNTRIYRFRLYQLDPLHSTSLRPPETSRGVHHVHGL